VNEYNGTTYEDTSYEGAPNEGKSSEEIRAEIERTRSQMGDKIDTIQDRLSPDHLKQQAQTMVQDIVQDSTDAIVEFARTGSKQAGRTLLDTIKANPLPSAVIGVGIGWLAMNMMKSQGESDKDRYGYPGSYGSMYNRGEMEYGSGYTGGRGMGQGAMMGARVPFTGSSYGESYAGEYGYEEEWHNNPDVHPDSTYQRSESGGMGETIGKVGEAAKDAAGKVGETAQNLAGTVADAAQSAAGAVGGAAHGVADVAGRAGEGAGSVAESAKHAGQQARHQAMQAGRMAAGQAGSLAHQGQYQAGRMGRTVQRSLEDNPVAFGAAALLAGVAIALALPATRQERQLFGDVRDQVMDKAQSLATTVAEETKQVANEVQPRLQETAQRVAEDLKSSGAQISEDLKQTGKEAGREVKQTLEDAGKTVKNKVESSGEKSETHQNDTEIVSGVVVEEDKSQPKPNVGGSYDKQFDAKS
jgi:hypothetical protein